MLRLDFRCCYFASAFAATEKKCKAKPPATRAKRKTIMPKTCAYLNIAAASRNRMIENPANPRHHFQSVDTGKYIVATIKNTAISMTANIVPSEPQPPAVFFIPPLMIILPSHQPMSMAIAYDGRIVAWLRLECSGESSQPSKDITTKKEAIGHFLYSLSPSEWYSA